MAQEVFVFPASFAQQQLWFLDQLEPGSPLYNIPEAMRLSGPLSMAALEKSLNEIMRRQESLRTIFANVEGSPVQVIAPTMNIALLVTDISELTESKRQAEVERLIAEEARRPFDLARGPLVRAGLLKLAEDEHVLLMNTHHIISDGWSMGVFARELAALYEAFATERASPLAELPIQYADFVQWQREWLQGEVLQKQLSYWKEQLTGAPPVLELPTDRPRPAMQTFAGAQHSFVLPKKLSEELKALSQREGATLFMTLLAAFQTMLARYTGQEDIVVGSPVAGRNRTEVEELIGLFMNQLVLRADLSGDPGFTELLKRVRETTLGAYAHQEMPFEKLVKELHPERKLSLSHTPLFQVMFVLQNAPQQAMKLAGLTLSPLDVNSGTAKFDLRLETYDKPEGLSCMFEYNVDLFNTETIARMAGHFQTLLEGIVANPRQRLSTLPLLTEAEHHQFLVEWNDTKTEFPEDVCLHQLFEAQVAKRPDAVAVLFGDEQVTYAELNQRANKVAHHLRGMGVGLDARVGICVERSIEMVVGILGILKAGAAYVPLDPAYPQQRLAYMLTDTQAPVLLTQRRLVERLPQHAARVLCLDEDWQTIDDEGKEENPITGVTPENLSYVIYTSGSTGQPKGIAIRHRGVVNNITDLNQSFNVGPTDRVLALSSLSFDMCVYEVLGTLESGGAIVMPEPSVERDPARWAELMVRHGVTIWNSAPSLLEALVEYVTDHPEVRPRTLRLVLLGGDWVPVSLPDQLRALVPNVQIIVMGGATEASIHSIIYPVEKTDPTWKSIPYGRPMANQRAYVLDRNLQLVPVGVPGELHLGGIGLARGYFNRPELTAEKFVANPFAEESGDRLYKTGDSARFRPDGIIELLGRMDFQVKIRGYRIELGEIIAALRQHPNIEDAVAIMREDEPGNKRLVAYVVPSSGQTAPTTSELRNLLKKTLPEYMVPSAFVVLEALPISPNGKVDRRALPAPNEARPELEEAFIAPRSPVEEVVAGIWAEVLGVEEIGVRDNFFELGGHSLLATQVVSRLEESFQVPVPLRSLFESPTVAELAANMEATGEAAQKDVVKIAEVLIRLNQLSEDETKMMLAE